MQADLTEKLATCDWERIATELDEAGHAVIPALLTPENCAVLTNGYDAPALYRSRVVMARHGFGRGEYKYFAVPLPDTVQTLRSGLYPPLALIANRWAQALAISGFPLDHASFIADCHASGQTLPTPLLLRYGLGDYNCLHRDLYGTLYFPMQVAILLSRPDEDFSGGEFVLTEQRPRMQSRVQVVPLRQGDAVIFAVHQRPVHGGRGVYRVMMRHGVSRIRAGARQTLGIIFHDAE